ncbi:MAG TPA: hypothetical protein VGD79_09760 [Thermoanaerobaculia bacterium]
MSSLPFVPALIDALEAFRFRRVEHANSELLLKRQTFNMNRAVVVVNLPAVPFDFRAYRDSLRRDVAQTCKYIPVLWGIGIQLIAVAPGILSIDPSQHIDVVDNQWAIVQSLFLVDPDRREYRSARTWGQVFTGKYQNAIETVLRGHYTEAF